MKPPKKLLDDLRNRTKKLIDGQHVDIAVYELGLMISCDLEWIADEDGTWSNPTFTPMVNLSNLERRLVRILIDEDKMPFLADKYVHASTQMVSFEVRIRAVCEDADETARQYDEFDWERDIVDALE